MFNFINRVLSPGEAVDFQQLKKEGALIVDVRTPHEFNGGHIPNSKNIPLQQLSNKLDSLNPHKPIIVCCASGARSGSAKRMLAKAGFENVHNGGGWQLLHYKLQE